MLYFGHISKDKCIYIYFANVANFTKVFVKRGLIHECLNKKKWLGFQNTLRVFHVESKIDSS